MKLLILTAVLSSMLFATHVGAEESPPEPKVEDQQAKTKLPGFPEGKVEPALPGLTPENQPFVIKVKVLCGTASQMEALLVPAKEIVMAKLVVVRASGPVELPGRPAPGVMMINPRTKTWTILENLAPNVYCITGAGPAMAPFGDGVGQAVDYVKPPAPESNNQYKDKESN